MKLSDLDQRSYVDEAAVGMLQRAATKAKKHAPFSAGMRAQARGKDVTERAANELALAFRNWVGRTNKDVNKLTPEDLVKFLYSQNYGKTGKEIVDAAARAKEEAPGRTQGAPEQNAKQKRREEWEDEKNPKNPTKAQIKQAYRKAKLIPQKGEQTNEAWKGAPAMKTASPAKTANIGRKLPKQPMKAVTKPDHSINDDAKRRREADRRREQKNHEWMKKVRRAAYESESLSEANDVNEQGEVTFNKKEAEKILLDVIAKVAETEPKALAQKVNQGEEGAQNTYSDQDLRDSGEVLSDQEMEHIGEELKDFEEDVLKMVERAQGVHRNVKYQLTKDIKSRMASLNAALGF